MTDQRTTVVVAADIRKHSPDSLPFGLDLGLHQVGYSTWATAFTVDDVRIPDRIAEAVLIAAMVMDGDLHRRNKAWYSNEPGENAEGEFADEDCGGPLGACHAAWRWSKGIA